MNTNTLLLLDTSVLRPVGASWSNLLFLFELVEPHCFFFNKLLQLKNFIEAALTKTSNTRKCSTHKCPEFAVVDLLLRPSLINSWEKICISFFQLHFNLNINLGNKRNQTKTDNPQWVACAAPEAKRETRPQSRTRTWRSPRASGRQGSVGPGASYGQGRAYGWGAAGEESSVRNTCECTTKSTGRIFFVIFSITKMDGYGNECKGTKDLSSFLY